ncbi:hypothetical protein BOX15_Mlig027025g2 [Macrostomum lignano]|uniref:RNA-directed DNA polymerase n=2 Tax=Macrostomum lignano TaxID=282301 RepID=A0A267EQA6_9PLAT|nr:hypothetical protein BOX15_Mlig027025g2 [Macrostomum lignano]
MSSSNEESDEALSPNGAAGQGQQVLQLQTESSTSTPPEAGASSQQAAQVGDTSRDAKPPHGMAEQSDLSKVLQTLTMILEKTCDREASAAAEKLSNSSPKLRPPPPFQPQMNFELWETQFLTYVEAHHVPTPQQPAVLLSMLAPECQEFIFNNSLHRESIQTALKSLKDRFTDSGTEHKSYLELAVAEQLNSETTQEFFDRLTRLSKSANLKKPTAEPLVRARFCYGLRDKGLAERLILLGQENPTWSAEDLAKKAREIAGVKKLLSSEVTPVIRAAAPDRTAELEARIRELEKLVQQNQTTQSSDHNSKDFQNFPSQVPPVNLGQSGQYKNSSRWSKSPKRCNRCSDHDHLTADCPKPPPSNGVGAGGRPTGMAPMMEIGTITVWKGGFGFIQPSQMPDSLFCHYSSLDNELKQVANSHQLVGTTVQFLRRADPGHKHDRAVGVCRYQMPVRCDQSWAADTPVESSMFVQLGIGDNKVIACLDSGCNASVMGTKVRDQLIANDPINNTFIPARKYQAATAFNGTSTQILGTLHCEVKLGKISQTHVFLVTEGQVTDVLLGIDFMRGFNVNLLVADGQVTVAGEVVPVIEGDRGVFQARRVTAACNVQLPPRSETMVPSRVIGADPGSPGFLGTKLFCSDSEFFVAHSVDSVSSTGHVLVRLLNSGNQPSEIAAGQEIASFQSLRVGETISHTALTEKDFSVSSSKDLGTKLAKLPDPDLGTASWLKKQFKLEESTLSETQLTITLKLLNYFLSAISKSDTDLGKTHLHEMAIELNEPTCRPISQPSRRTTPAQKEFLDRHINQLIEQGVIEESNSEWASPIVLVRKKDGSQRLCIDYRSVNKVIKPCTFPLPLIEESFDSLAGSKVFSSLDLTSAYWQVGIREQDRDLTAFTCPQGTYRWKVVPFGIKTAPANFAKLMHKVFRPLLMRVSLIYLDDIIIKARDNDEMIVHLALVLWQLKKANLKIKPSKCELFKDRVRFLGFVVSSQGIEADPTKIDAVRNWCKPTDKRQLLAFLGFANYYRKFVARFSVIASPLYSLAKGSSKFCWLEHHDRAFEELKANLCAPPVLAYPDLKPSAGPFILDCDSSLEGVGGVLSQEGPDGQEHVVAYASKKFTHSQRNYCATMRELLGLVIMLEHFRTYLLDRSFLVRSDAAALQWLHTKKHSTGMLAQWLATIDVYNFKVCQTPLERLAEYDFSVEHRPGRDHVNADMLSRNPRFRSDHHDCPTCSKIPAFQDKFRKLEEQRCQDEDEDTDSMPAVQLRTAQIDACCQTEPHQSNQEPKYPSEILTSHEGSDEVRSHRSLSLPSTAQDPDPEGETSEDEMSENSENLWAREAQESSTDLVRLIEAVEGKSPRLTKVEVQDCSREIRTLWAMFDELEVVNGLLTRVKPAKQGQVSQRLIIIPETADVDELVSCYHRDINHCGINKTVRALKQRFQITNLEVFVKGIIAECEVCCRTKKNKRKNKEPLEPILSGYPNQIVHVDHAGPFPEQEGNRYLLVLVDNFSGYVEIVPVPDVSAATTATVILTEWIVRYGTMEKLVSDNGTAFINKTVAELTRLLEIDMARITAHRPQSNGKAERTIQSIKAQIRAICLEKRVNWVYAARLAGLSIRTTVAESTGWTPARLFFGRELVLPLDLLFNPPRHDRYDPDCYAHKLHKLLVEVSAIARMERGKAQQRQKRNYDRNTIHSNFEIGELVWVLNPDHRGLDSAVWLGPYKVVQKVSERNYRLIPEFARINPICQTPNPSHNIYNVDRMKRCIRKQTYQDIADRFELRVPALIPPSRLGQLDDQSESRSDSWGSSATTCSEPEPEAEVPNTQDDEAPDPPHTSAPDPPHTPAPDPPRTLAPDPPHPPAPDPPHTSAPDPPHTSSPDRLARNQSPSLPSAFVEVADSGNLQQDYQVPEIGAEVEVPQNNTEEQLPESRVHESSTTMPAMDGLRPESPTSGSHCIQETPPAQDTVDSDKVEAFPAGPVTTPITTTRSGRLVRKPQRFLNTIVRLCSRNGHLSNSA